MSKKLKRIFAVPLILTLVIVMGMVPSAPQGGMYPLSEISSLDLQEAGLKISPEEIYNPDGIGLIDALVKIGGCTGSFVSEYGLIITNHHCAFGAINRASTTEQNYLENGFLAENATKEIPALGYTCRITESYEDVSEKILSQVKDISDLTERSKKIKEISRALAKEASDPENSIEAKVSEMFIGQTYVLFKYRLIKDVRLVYAPPRSIGEFGGETDNWIWPRHTADFTFMRAYVAPDGQAADYSEDNVPYTPKKYLKVNASGVKENDFVFILGYPGRTFRHRPAQYVSYLEEIQMPFIADVYEWTINKLEAMGDEDPEYALQTASMIKGLANTKKNYRGKLRGLKRLNLVEKKQLEEEQLQKYINNTPELNTKYSSLLNDINAVYEKQFEIGLPYLWNYMSARNLSSLRIQKTVKEFLDGNTEADEAKETISSILANYNPELEKAYLEMAINKAVKENFSNQLDVLEPIKSILNDKEKIAEYINTKIYNSSLLDKDKLDAFFELPKEEIEKDPLFTFSNLILNQFKVMREEMESIESALNKLLADLYDVKKSYKKENFIPDANSTLRLTYGNIKGYSPADAMYYSPISALSGVIDKSLLGGEYQIPAKLKELYDAKDFGDFYDEDLEDVPVCILYNTDTSGGNSGSPVLNAYGELIGLNFDRAYEATINDFAWNDSYSRSIGVDIRYILWIAQKLGGADYLIEEMSE